MNNTKAIIFALMLVLLSPAAFALVWDTPYWMPPGTSDPHSISFGDSTTAASSGFSSIDTTVHYRAELRRASGSLVTVLEEHDVDISRYTGFETVDIDSFDYVSGGEYWVRFIISDSHETETKQLRLVVSDESDSTPSADLSATPTTGLEGMTVSFTCVGTGGDGSLSYLIEFGDGYSAASSSTSHRYANAGDFTATCTVMDEDGDSDTDSVSIHVGNNAPVVTLDVAPTSGDAPLTVDYDCSAAGGNAPLSYNIDFGEGTFTTTSSGSYTYDAEGDYSIVCTVIDADGDFDSDSVTVNVGSADTTPVVTLTATPSDVLEGENVHFECTATGGDGALSYHIDFNDGESVDSAMADHSYAVAGIYTALCVVTDADGDVGSDDAVVNVADNVPVVSLTATPVSGDAPLEVDFTCTVTGGNSPLAYTGIDFGDGTFAETLSATHTYVSEGLYVASCTVVDADGDLASDSEGIDVGAGNECPVFDAMPVQIVRAGETLEFSLSAHDTDGHALTYFADMPFTTFLTDDGRFSWTPVELQVGRHVATFRVTDGFCVDVMDVTIEVLPGMPDNRPPVANFTWNPVNPEVGEDVDFTSTSSDPNGDVLTCAWDFDDDTWIDSTDCDAAWTFERPGEHDVTLTVSDGELSDFVTHTIIVTGQLNVTEISCFDPVVEGSLQACSVSVRANGVSVGGANARIFYEDGTEITNCITDALTGNCIATFATAGIGTYTVYATAEKPLWLPDLDADPTFTFDVLAQRYMITDLAVYNEPSFTVEDYDFFRGEDMFVHFRVFDESGVPANDMVTSVSLVSPPGGVAWFHEFAPNTEGNYWYDLTIPITHDFLGDSHVFTFAFNFTDGSGAQMVVEVIIRNNPPVIDPAVADEFSGTFDDVTIIPLTPYESDVEDSGRGLRWSVLGVDPAVAEVSIDLDDFMTVTPLASGLDWITLVLTDLDGDTDMIDIPINTGGMPVLAQCEDGIDNDGDGLIDLADPGCENSSDNDESDDPALPQCNNGLDDDGDGLVDLADPGCVDSSDDNETDPVVLPACSDGIDNDGDGLIDMADPDCSSPDDNDEAHTPQCADGFDNDGDGLVDLADPGCVSHADDDESDDPVSEPACNDHVDNDGDGLVDMADPGCTSPGDDDETDPIVLPQCADGIDNDGDGLIDLADPGCTSPGDDDETDPVVLAACEDGADNDGDGLVDMADPGCTAPSDNDEYNDPALLTACSDGLDNDGDGLVDLADPGCTDASDDDELDFAGNQPPISIIDLSRTYGAPGMIVSVDGNRSYDPDGSIVEHSWVLTGPGGFTYSDLHVVGMPGSFLVQFFDEGTYEFRLTVVDDEGADDTDIVTLHISSGYAQCDNGIDDDGDGNIDWPADLHCSDKNDPFEGEIDVSTKDKPFRDMDDLLITRIDIDGMDVEHSLVAPGEYFRLGLGLQNTLDYELDDIKVDVSIQELGVRDADILRELGSDDSANVVLNLDIPDWVGPGLYDMRIVVSNDEIRRVKYRVVTIA